MVLSAVLGDVVVDDWHMGHESTVAHGPLTARRPCGGSWAPPDELPNMATARPLAILGRLRLTRADGSAMAEVERLEVCDSHIDNRSTTCLVKSCQSRQPGRALAILGRLHSMEAGAIPSRWYPVEAPLGGAQLELLLLEACVACEP